MQLTLILPPRLQAPWEQGCICLVLSYILSAQQGAWYIASAPKILVE